MAPLILLINCKMVSWYVIVSLLIISLSLMNNCYALQERKNMVETDYDTFHVRSLLSTSCKSSLQGPTSRPASLKVTHKHGPCSKQSQPTLLEVLARDQIRVASVQNSQARNTKMDKLGSSKATLPAKSGTTIGSGNYVVTIGLGTPTKYVDLLFDTGSSLTWTQCQPCSKYCYNQKDPIFNPKTSASYGNVSCLTNNCAMLKGVTGITPSCLDLACIYDIKYGDQSFSIGFFGKEKLTLTPHDVFDNFFFGCGENSRGLFGNSAGLLGLGRDNLSIVVQTAQKYGKHFSYCLPTKSGSNGHLTFGKYPQAPRNLVFTPLTTSSQGSSFYFVNTIAISVGGRQLPISPSVFHSGGTIIDSGTVITRLAPTAYTTLRDAFRQQMSKYLKAPAISILDTCYDLSNHTTITIPKISFIFEGNAKVDLGFKGILVAASQSQICLAFSANNADSDTGIYGNVQQQTFEVAYDVAAGKLGFGPAGCS